MQAADVNAPAVPAPSGDIWNHLEASRRHAGGGQETPMRQPAGTQVAPRRNPGGTQEGPRRHPAGRSALSPSSPVPFPSPAVLTLALSATRRQRTLSPLPLMKQRSSIRSLPFSLPFFDSGCTCSFCWGYRVPILRRNPGRCRRSYACVLWKGDHARRHNLLCSMAFHAAEAANLQPRRPADLMRPTNPINPINPINPVTRTSPISPIILISLRCPINTIIPTSPISPIGQSIKTELLNFPDRANNNPHGGSNGHGCCPACGHIWLGWPQMLQRSRELVQYNK